MYREEPTCVIVISTRCHTLRLLSDMLFWCSGGQKETRQVVYKENKEKKQGGSDGERKRECCRYNQRKMAASNSSPVLINHKIYS